MAKNPGTGKVNSNRVLGGVKLGEEILGRKVRKRIYNRFYRQGPRVPIIWQNVGLGLLAVVAIGIGAFILFT
ncbi:hypothetical protein [Paeniglutamicibacter psychrophenolicus]|uniref:hypothetical protein n=1 Tax=Paeniglutamicibacter psychrophenolicus TaxID=257454 RepID=UPI0027834D3C|nr:hypothetical protein [Paeniglutamicibacter psychrophenolicus]MDQ0094689.1 hypothetical protein [Paeniglutamicibacter psychrophenolicus]